MRSLKLMAAGLTVSLGILAGATAHAAATRIVVVTHGQAADPYWSMVKNGRRRRRQDDGRQCRVQLARDLRHGAMAQMIDAAVATKPDGIVVSIPDADALGPSIKQRQRPPASR